MHTTLHEEIKKYRPVLQLSTILPRRALTRLRILFGVLFTLSLAATIGSMLALWPQTLPVSDSVLLGLTLLFGALWLEEICLYAYHNWYFFRGLDSTIGKQGKVTYGITYTGAEIFYCTEQDCTRSFITADFGRACLARLEVADTVTDAFLHRERTHITTKQITIGTMAITTTTDLIEQLYELDHALQTMLTEQGVSKELLLATVQFVEEIENSQKHHARWWSRDELSHIVGIGSELAYGDTPLVSRFSKSLLGDTIFSRQTGSTPFTQFHADQILQILAAHSASNVLLVGEVGVGKMDIVYTVAQQLTYGDGLHALHGHHIVVVDTERLLSAASTTESPNELLAAFFDEALGAGNITLVIPSLQTFLIEGLARHLAVTDILETYLAHPSLHIIALDTPYAHHEVLTAYKSITRQFEQILVEPANHHDTLTLLRAAVPALEQTTGAMISYPALLMVVEAAERYLTDGVMPDRAIALLTRVFDTSTTAVITKETVTAYVTAITGMTIGTVSPDERAHLLSLEETLSGYVTGQPAAIKAVADTLRRTRIDTSRSDKPKGTFLFLGPTGVGKTALAKALATVYSKNESVLVRFDMTEFSHSDALGYLIGDHNGTGMLTDQLRDHPFSVVLFDEFEKAHPSIHDLFLQILDEGYFTSTHGTRVDARNIIIIATSNAGGALISRTTNTPGSHPVLLEELLRHLIETGVFRPELLNRFDETIIFRPLDQHASRYIIQKQLSMLTERLRHDGYSLQLDEAIVELLLEKGFSPAFGARPLTRAIQDLVEAEIAKQIIAHGIKPGGTVYVTAGMIAERG